MPSNRLQEHQPRQGRWKDAAGGHDDAQPVVMRVDRVWKGHEEAAVEDHKEAQVDEIIPLPIRAQVEVRKVRTLLVLLMLLTGLGGLIRCHSLWPG